MSMQSRSSEKGKYPYGIQNNEDQQSFYNKLLYLEEQFHSKVYDNDCVSQLVRCYGTLVEFYDEVRDPIKDYFLEKMQYVVSRPETLEVIINTKSKKKTKKDVTFSLASPTNDNDQNASIIDDRTKSHGSPSRYSISKKKQERVTQVKIYLQAYDQQEAQDQDMKDLLMDYELASKEYSKLIQEQLSTQEEQLKLKLEKRSQDRRRSTSLNKDNILKYQQNKGAKKNMPENKPPKLIYANSGTSKKVILEEIKESTRFMRQSSRRMSNSKSFAKSSMTNQDLKVFSSSITSQLMQLEMEENSDEGN